MRADRPPTDTFAAVVRWAAALLLLGIATLQTAYGLLMWPLAAAAVANSPDLLPPLAWLRGGAVAGVFVSLSVLASALTVVAAAFLAVDRRRGWWIGLAAALLWLPTGCSPLSALILAALAVPGVRPATATAAPTHPAAG